MKKVVAAMAAMFVVLVPLVGLWGILLKPILSGVPEQSFIYPIYIGLTLVAGLIVGSAVVFYEEIKNFGKK